MKKEVIKNIVVIALIISCIWVYKEINENCKIEIAKGFLIQNGIENA